MKTILIKTPYKGLFITETGKAWRNDLKIEIKPTTNGKIRFNGKLYDLQKLINYSRQNATKIKRINSKQPPPSETDLIKCIRFYFEVQNNFKSSSYLFKYYLYQLILKRGFEWRCASCTDFDLFLDYCKNDFYTSKNQTSVFKKFNYTATNGKNAINKYLNLLVNECLQDFENGLLQLKDFAPKPPTKTQKLKQLQKSVNEYGLNIKIPLRKPSVKELFNRYKKKTNEINELTKKPL